VAILRISGEVERLGALALEDGEFDVVGKEEQSVRIRHGDDVRPVQQLSLTTDRKEEKTSGVKCSTNTLRQESERWCFGRSGVEVDVQSTGSCGFPAVL